MNFCHICAGYVPPKTSPTGPTLVIGTRATGEPIHTDVTNCGVPPMNQASALSSVLPVLPKAGRSMLAFVPVPRAMTPFMTSTNVRAVSGLIAGVPDGAFSRITVPSGASTRVTKIGGWYTPSAAIVATTLAISSGDASAAPSVTDGTTGISRCTPIACARSTTLWGPSPRVSRAYAQLIDSSVAARSVIWPPPWPPGVQSAEPGILKTHPPLPSTLSSGEYPLSRAAASVTILNVDPGWRAPWVARLYCASSKLGPPTIAFTYPVAGSIATSDAVNSDAGSVVSTAV